MKLIRFIIPINCKVEFLYRLGWRLGGGGVFKMKKNFHGRIMDIFLILFPSVG